MAKTYHRGHGGAQRKATEVELAHYNNFDTVRYNDYYESVSSNPKATTRTRRPGALEEQVFINLMLTSDLLARRLEPVLKAAEISPTQYNVLRILRGAPEGLACGEIGSRMISRDPDITRLLDRLEKRKLVSRCRETKDRRMVLTRITDAGLKLLAQLDAPVLDAHHLQLGHLGQEKLRVLLGLLQQARGQGV